MLPSAYYSPVISVLVDDKPRNMLLDTGGFWSLISPAISAGYKMRKSVIKGKLGLFGLPVNYSVIVPSVQIGIAKFSKAEFSVAPQGYLTADGTLGANWLAAFDVEIDPVKNTASLFSHDHCEGQVIYWPHQERAVVPFVVTPVENRITLELILNGKTVKALLDTGAPDSVISLQAAKRLFDLTPDSPGVEVSGSQTDKRGQRHKTYRYQFKSLEMGEIAFKNPWITLSEIHDEGLDMILGMHQLHALHLYFAYREQKLYLTTASGDIAARKAAAETSSAQPTPLRDPLARINAQDLKQSALQALWNRNVDAALTFTEKAIKTDSTFSDLFVLRANIHLMKKEIELARQDLDHAIELDPTNLDVYADRSQMEWQLGNLAVAVTDIDQLLQSNPGYIRGYSLRAGYEFVSGQRDKALADMSEAIRISPNDPSVRQTRAAIYAAGGDYAHAYEDQTVVVKLQPKSVSALNSRCWYGAILGKLDDALDDCDAALDIEPRAPAILDSRGFVRFKKGQWDRAVSDYSAAIEINPKFASSLYGRGLARRQKGDQSGADADIAAAQAIDPDIAQHFGK